MEATRNALDKAHALRAEREERQRQIEEQQRLLDEEMRAKEAAFVAGLVQEEEEAKRREEEARRALEEIRAARAALTRPLPPMPTQFAPDAHSNSASEAMSTPLGSAQGSTNTGEDIASREAMGHKLRVNREIRGVLSKLTQAELVLHIVKQIEGCSMGEIIEGVRAIHPKMRYRSYQVALKRLVDDDKVRVDGEKGKYRYYSKEE